MFFVFCHFSLGVIAKQIRVSMLKPVNTRDSVHLFFKNRSLFAVLFCPHFIISRLVRGKVLYESKNV